MKTTIRLFVIFLLFEIMTSCKKDEMIDADYFSFLYYRIEDESGRDLQKDLHFCLDNGTLPEIPSMCISHVYDFERESTGERWVPHYDCRKGFYEYREVALHITKIRLYLFEQDVEKIVLYGCPTMYKDNMELEWEYKNKKIPMSDTGKTYMTFIRHDDGTYTLK